MKTKRALVLIMVLILSIPGSLAARDVSNMLSDTYSTETLRDIILSVEDWHPFPTLSEHEAWQNLPGTVREAHIKLAEEYLGCGWETPKASLFLEYVRNGNRSHYQETSFGRRAKLAALVIGECFEGEGRFLDDIMNGVWAICEETYWGVPAHVGLQERGPGLPDVTEPTVDLFAAETGMLLAWTDYLVGKQLDHISHLIRERIHHEVDRRILSVNLEREDFWWMGFGGQTVNNWNPWICSNWLTAVLLLEADPERKARSIHKIMRCLDNFLKPYPRDGGCDEGPGYWDRAGGSLFDCLELLYGASRGRIDFFDNPLVKEMGLYICRAYIGYPYFINFADAAARIDASADLIYRYGKSIRDDAMMGFGAFLARKQHLGEGALRGGFGALGRVLPTMFNLEELMAAEPEEPLSRDFWLPELEVMGARSFEGSKRSFYVAAKGGHNAESHNHNDVGNFIVYVEGYPVLIDAGVETYTAKTFSDKRYEIWTMQSAYHNLPTVNGCMQREGREYRAEKVRYQENDDKAIFNLDIAPAYPDEAGVKSWRRTVTLNRGKGVMLEERYELENSGINLELSLVSWPEPVLVKEGVIRLEMPESNVGVKPVYLRYDEKTLEVSFETITLEDARLRSSWGGKIYRILLTAKKKNLKGRFSILVEQ